MLLNDPRISRRHIYIQAVGGWVFWVDLESRTGTQTERGQQKSGWLTGDGFLGIGSYIIRRRATATDRANEAALGKPPSDLPITALACGREPLPEVALEFLNGPSKSTFWPMHRVISMIGSAKSCKFRLTDRTVAPIHASLLRTPAGLWVVDLRGGHSISVNGVPMRCSGLDDGDVLGIGRYRIRVRCRHHDNKLGVRSTDSARVEPNIEAAWQLSRGPEKPGLLVPNQLAGAVGSLMPPGDMQRPNSTTFPNMIATIGMTAQDAILSTRVTQTDVSESALVPLVNQFNMMQQQMFDQFQQAMGMLVQMFGTMHREQMEVIREELDRLHELSKELQELKEELAKPSRQSPQPVELGAAASPTVPPTLPPRVVSAPESPTTPSPTRWPPIAASAGPTSPIPPPSLGSLLNQSTPQPAKPVAAGGHPSKPATPGVQPGAHPDHDAVAWIHQRIMTIQSERETRWQKILKLLPGVS